MSSFSTAVISPPEHDGLIVELRQDEKPIAEVREENRRVKISFYSTDDLRSFTTTVDDFNHAIKLLKHKASEVFEKDIQ
ncbi:MAG: hypothetical protein ACPG4Q_10840 [Phycisphaeraceae bacterium]